LSRVTGLFQSDAGGGHAENDVFDADERFQQIRKLSDFLRLSPDGQNFKAIMVVDMDMLRTNDKLLKVMLNVDDFIYQFPFMMVVGQRDGAGDFLITEPLFFDKVGADQIPDRFRSISVILSFDMIVEFFDQILFKGYAKPIKVGHRMILLFPGFWYQGQNLHKIITRQAVFLELEAFRPRRSAAA
jgi:hypothetical protein